jgi:hypothetical protein
VERAAYWLDHDPTGIALLYMEGQLFPQDFTRASELLRNRRASRPSGGALFASA